MRCRAFVVGLTTVAALAACGVDVVGTAPSDIGAVEAGAPGVAEAGVDGGGPDVSSVPPPSFDGGCRPTSCGIDAPEGWTLVTVAAPGAACPPSFTAKDLLADPVAPPQACECSCSVTATPSCTSNQRVATRYDGATCSSTSNALQAYPDGTCRGTSLAPGDHELFPSPPPSGPATCKATTTPRPTNVTTTPVRLCVAPSCDGVCTGAGTQVCIVAAGERECPGGLTKRRLGEGTDVTCPACGCTATPPAKCTGTWSLYTDSNCMSVQDAIAADTCLPTKTNTVRSYRWAPDPVIVACAAAPVPGVPSLTGPATLCCK